MALSVLRLWRTDPLVRFGALASLPVLGFYLIVSLFTDAEANWPIAGYATLAPGAAVFLSRELPRRAALLRAWRALPRPRPRAGFLRRAPETLPQVLWHWSIAWGLAAFIAVMAIAPLSRAPLVGRFVPRHRVSGHRAVAELAAGHAAALRERTGAEPMYIADHYMRAALLAYYAPGRPSACSAVSLLGGRRSSYDFFPDTDLRGPALLGRPAVLVGAAPERWDRALSFDEVFPLSIRQGRTPAMAAGLNYRGPRSEPAPPVPAEPRP